MRGAGILVLMIIKSSQCGGTHQVLCQGWIVGARARSTRAPLLPLHCSARNCLGRVRQETLTSTRWRARADVARLCTARRVWADPRWPLAFGTRARRFFCAACKPRERKAEPAPARRQQAERRRAGRRVTGGDPWGMVARRGCHERGEGGVGRDAVLCAPALHELACVDASSVGHCRLRLRQGYLRMSGLAELGGSRSRRRSGKWTPTFATRRKTLSTG